jgi:hypothetical protein
MYSRSCYVLIPGQCVFEGRPVTVGEVQGRITVHPALYNVEPDFMQNVRKVFGFKRDEVTGDWRILRNEFYDLYCSPNTF